MSIASELSRLLQAKSDLATSITNKGVNVPAATTIDGYAALVDQIQTGGAPPMPQGAVEISYIQGDGSAFIDTGIKGSSDIGFKFSINITSSLPTASTSIVGLMGSRVGSTDRAFTVQFYNTSGSKYFRWAFASAAVTQNHTGTKGNYILSNLDRHRVMVTTGAKELVLENTSAIFSSDLNIYLLTFNNNGTAASAASNVYTRIYYCQLFDQNTLVRDFVPIRIGQVGYLFDKVSGGLFGNANSTGAFTLGPDVT